MLTVNPSVGSGLDRDSDLGKLLTRLAKLRHPTATQENSAAFKEGEKAYPREASE